MKRGERKTVTVDFTEFGDSAILNQEPDVIRQPMLNAQQITVVKGPNCT